MALVEASLPIERSAAEVFEFLARIENNRMWQTDVNWSRWTRGPEWEMGSTYEQSRDARGGERKQHYRVTQFVDGEQLGVASAAGPLHFDWTTTVVERDAGSEVTSSLAVRQVYEGRGILRWDPTYRLLLKLRERSLTSRRGRKRLMAELERLKRFLET